MSQPPLCRRPLYHHQLQPRTWLQRCGHAKLPDMMSAVYRIAHDLLPGMAVGAHPLYHPTMQAVYSLMYSVWCDIYGVAVITQGLATRFWEGRGPREHAQNIQGEASDHPKCAIPAFPPVSLKTNATRDTPES